MQQYSGVVVGTTDKYGIAGRILKETSDLALMLGLNSPRPQKERHIVVDTGKEILNFPKSKYDFEVGTVVDLFPGLIDTKCCKKGETLRTRFGDKRIIDGKILDVKPFQYEALFIGTVFLNDYLIETANGRIETGLSKRAHAKNDIVQVVETKNNDRSEYVLL
jgi:hypothetical protein